MMKVCSTIVSVLSGAILTSASWANSDLSATETKWLDAAEPVLTFADRVGMRIDVIVTPESNTGDVPLSMGVQDHHCKLVVSMRGNTDAEATLSQVPADQHAVMIEAMAAHEMAHCWRYTQGAWHTLPAGFIAPSDSPDSAELRAKKLEMQSTRREEGYADLVALAWTLQKHPESYDEVHTWLERVRNDQPISGGYHDTRAWLALTKDRNAFRTPGSFFDQVETIWEKGLHRD